MSLDTEGCGALPNQLNGRNDRLFAFYGSPKTGIVLFFHNAVDTPESIRRLLKDFPIAKIQSGIAKDADLMQKIKIDVRGIIESATLFMLVQPG